MIYIIYIYFIQFYIKYKYKLYGIFVLPLILFELLGDFTLYKGSKKR